MSSKETTNIADFSRPETGFTGCSASLIFETFVCVHIRTLPEV